jgi:hypothetical protein
MILSLHDLHRSCYTAAKAQKTSQSSEGSEEWNIRAG